MRRSRVGGAAAIAFVVAACGGGSGSSGGVGTGNGVMPIYGNCAGVAPKAVAGSHTDPAGYDYAWPTGWDGATSGGLFAVSAPYSYVPTGSSVPTNATAYIDSTTSVAASDSDAQRIVDHPYGGSEGAVKAFTLGGLPASAFWIRTPPPQPGCAGCPGDPGPDLITIGVAVANGKTVFELTGTARLNAPDEVFCDMQQTEGSLALAH